ncbi:hypothetical protein BS17DRAFT_147489 [Gyrodon lividus]|nr:hypothetical protein BS17DRAFT_147489 [Gyrodon lividus]
MSGAFHSHASSSVADKYTSIDRKNKIGVFTCLLLMAMILGVSDEGITNECVNGLPRVYCFGQLEAENMLAAMEVVRRKVRRC